MNFRKGEAYAYTRFPTADSMSIVGRDASYFTVRNPRSNAKLYPTGFDPIITSRLTDAHGAMGVRGTFGEFDVDLSNGFGSNRFHYGVDKTMNATLGAASPRSSDAGGFKLRQNVVNLDASRSFKTCSKA